LRGGLRRSDSELYVMMGGNGMMGDRMMWGMGIAHLLILSDRVGSGRVDQIPVLPVKGAEMREAIVMTVAAGALGLVSPALSADGNAARGQRVFGACAACHSLQPDRNMTGPSLSGLWHRKAGALESFSRYSPALKSSGVIWDDNTLDPWITGYQST